MSKKIKYFLRLYIVGVPLYLLKISIRHLTTCTANTRETICVWWFLSILYVVIVLFSMLVLLIGLVYEYWDDIWSDD